MDDPEVALCANQACRGQIYKAHGTWFHDDTDSAWCEGAGMSMARPEDEDYEVTRDED